MTLACPHHPDKAYIKKDGRLLCPECGYISPYQPVPSYDDLLVENTKLKMRVAELSRFIEDYAESANTKTDFQSWAEKLVKKQDRPSKPQNPNVGA